MPCLAWLHPKGCSALQRLPALCASSVEWNHAFDTKKAIPFIRRYHLEAHEEDLEGIIGSREPKRDI